MSIKAFVIAAAVVGFVLPTFWVFVGIGLMGSSASWAHALWTVAQVTCPFGLTDTGGWGIALGKSFLNALLYGAIVGVLVGCWKQLHAESRQ